MDQFPNDYNTYLSANYIGKFKHEPLYPREFLILLTPLCTPHELQPKFNGL